MLQLAIKAGLPLISVETDDAANALKVISYITYELTGQTAKVWDSVKHKKNLEEGTVYVSIGTFDAAGSDLYGLLDHKHSTIITVNGDEDPVASFQAGMLPVPKALVRAQLMEDFDDEDLVRSITPAIGGLTLQHIAEVIRLTMARDQSLTAVGIMRTRMSAFPAVRGLDPVISENDNYWPSEEMAELVSRNKLFFLSDIDPRLVPRGILLTGGPGTGKTAFSKYVSRMWGVPLFRFDLGAVKDKYVGGSEAYMRRMIQQVEREAPCIVLIDEVEKLFRLVDGSNDTTGQLLSYLLWWMGERTSQVYVVMTTNEAAMLPAELYRPGRIDSVVEIKPLTLDQAVEFAVRVLETFKDVIVEEFPDEGQRGILAQSVVHEFWLGAEEDDTASHAEIINAITESVKEVLLTRAGMI